MGILAAGSWRVVWRQLRGELEGEAVCDVGPGGRLGEGKGRGEGGEGCGGAKRGKAEGRRGRGRGEERRRGE